MPTSRFRNPTTGKVISFEHSEGISQSELQNLAKVQYINALNEEDNFAVDVVKGIGAGGVKALIDAGAGAQSAVAQVIEASGKTDKDNRFINALFSNAEYLRKVSNEFDETIGLDQDFANSFGGELAYGFGQMPVQIATSLAGGAAGAAVGGLVGGPPGAIAGGAIGAIGVGGGFAAAQMQTEAVRDAETTLGKSYSEFTDEEKRQTAMSSLAYMTIGGALEYFAVSKVVPKSVKSKLRRFVTGKESLPSGEVKQVFKSLKREAAEGALFEGMTESAQGQLLDTLASATYDDDRELISMDVLAQRFNEFAVGAIVGGGTTTAIGTAERITGGKPLTKPKETPVQDQASISGKKKFKVTYQRQAADGTKSEISTTILANSQEEAQAEANKLLESDPSVVSQTLTVQGETEAAPGLVPTPSPEPTPTPTPAPTAPPTEQPAILTEEDFGDPLTVGVAGPETRQLQFNDDEALNALPSKEKARYNRHIQEPIQRGAVRLNLNSKFNKEGVQGPLFVQTLHPIKKSGSPEYGNAHSYSKAFTLKNATFSVNPFAKTIIRSKAENKYPMASVDGDIVNTEPSLEGEVLSFNPFRDDSFVDSQGRVVIGADEVTVYGTKAYARGNIRYAEESPEVVTASEILELNKSGKKYKHPKFHPRGISINLDEDQVQKLEALAASEGEPDVVAEAAPFTAPKKSRLSHVKQSDIIDIDALIEEIVEEGAPVWFWGADQLGEGTIQLPNQKGMKIKLDAGPSYALKPDNRAAGRVWASSMSVTGINNRINDLKYTDKDGNEKTGYIFLVSGSPNRMHLFNKQAFKAFYENAFAGMSFKKVKSELLAAKPTKPVRDILNKHNSLESLIDSADSKPFIEALVDQRSKTKSKMFQYLDSKGFYTLEHARLLDGFYRKHNFQQNDIMLVVQPTKATDDDPKHGTYKNSVYGKVIGVPDKRLDAYLLMPERIMKGRPVTLEPNQAAQVVTPYGSRVTEIQKVVGSQQAQRAVKKLLRIIKENPDGFTVDTAGEFADGGFIVAPDKETELLLSRETLDEESLTRYIIEHADKLSVDGAMLGGWFNTESGEYVLDVVFSVDNLGDAVDIAIWGDQDAIFDLDTFTEIRTKDDNKNPTTPPDDSRTASEILNQRPSESLGEYASQRRREPRGVRPAVPRKPSEQAAVVSEAGTSRFLVQDLTSPEGGFNSIKEMEEFIRDTFKAIASKIGVDIEPSYAIFGEAQYNVTKGVIQYNPRNLFTARTKDGIRAAMREEIIHASMHRVLMQRSPSKSRNNSWLDFMSKLGKDLTAEQRAAISSVYSNLTTDDQFGAEYSRAAVQYALYGDVTEQYVVGGKSWETIKSVFKSIQSFLAKKLGKDVENREVAEVIRDSVALVRNTDPSARVTNQSVVEIAQGISSGLPGMSSENISDPYIEPIEVREKKERKKKRGRLIRKFLQPASEFFGRINPDIAFLLSKYMTGLEAAQFRAASMVRNFQDGIAGIQNEADRSELGRLLSYSPEPQQIAEGQHKENIRRRDELLIKYDLYNSFQLQVRPMLDQLYQEAKAAGLDINYLTEYFPRAIKDFQGLMKLYGKDVQNDFNAYIEQENERRQARGEKLITEAEKPIEFEIYLNQKKFVNPSRIPANIKERRSNIITKKAERFYYKPEVALGSYLNNMIVAIETQKLLGTATRTKMKPSVIDGEAIKTFDLSDGSGSLSRLIVKLLAEGKLSEDQMSNLEWGLVQFFNPHNASEFNIFELGRTLSYGTLLVEPTSTLSQMYDLAFNMMDNGVFPALRVMFGGEKVRMRDLGLDPDRLAADYPATASGKRQFLNDVVRKGLSLTGFRRMDQLMKETNLTANYRRFQRTAKMSPNSGAFKKFRTELEFLVGSDADIVINDLKSGKEDSPYVRELLVRKLLETQPLNRFEMPLTVSSNPNTRMLYTMKSFMVKQMSLVGRKYVSVLFDRESTVSQRAVAAKDLVKLLIIFQIVGLPVDFLKDLLAGRDVYPGDYSTNALLRIAGMSKYTIYQAEKEGIGGALESYFMPVGVQQTFDMATDIGRIMTDISYVPDAKAVGYLPFSDLWYYRFGPGVEKQKKKRIRQRREGVTPFLRGL